MSKRVLISAVIAVAVWLACGSGAVHAQDAARPAIVTADGGTFAASLVELDGQTFTFRLDEAQARDPQRKVSARELVSWGAPVEADDDSPLVLIADGGAIAGDVVEVNDEVTIISDSLGEFRMPLESLAGVIFAPPYAVDARDALADRARRAGTAEGQPARGDWLLLENGDEMNGVITKIDDRAVHIETSLGAVAVERSRVVAAGFNPALRGAPADEGLRHWLGLADGSYVLAGKLTVKQGEAQATIAGAVVSFKLKELVHLQTLGGAVTYLSDLAPSSYVHVPYLSVEWPYRLDRSVTGARLRAGGRTYHKGVGMHASSRLTFAVGPGQKRLRGLIAIDDQTDGGGSVTFRVFVDSQQRYRSEIVRGGDPPRPIDVDVSGGKLVSLFVEAADGGDVLDRADWLDLRLSEK